MMAHWVIPAFSDQDRVHHRNYALIKLIATGRTIANTSHGLIGIDEVRKDIPQARAMADSEVTEATRVRSGSIRIVRRRTFRSEFDVREIAELPRVDVISATSERTTAQPEPVLQREPAGL
jgi:hypothetical protein